MLIDSHHHLWRYSPDQYGWISEEMSVLRQDFLLPELTDVAAGCGVDGFVTVQARQCIEETEMLLALAERESAIRGVVGWVPLVDPDVAAVLDRFADADRLKGIRHVVQDEPDDRFLLRDDFNRGVDQLAGRGLVYDILIFAHHLPAAIEFVDRHPNLPMVLDHIAKPSIRADQFDETWALNIRELARREHVSCKFSGVVTEVCDTDWSAATLQPYWQTALDAFTPKRLMFGSDWPVCQLRCDYSQWLAAARDLAAELSAEEQTDFFTGNAARIYQLSP